MSVITGALNRLLAFRLMAITYETLNRIFFTSQQSQTLRKGENWFYVQQILFSLDKISISVTHSVNNNNNNNNNNNYNMCYILAIIRNSRLN
jgi:hypothetical protein